MAVANEELAAAKSKLETIQVKIARLNEDLTKLTSEFETATEDKMKCANDVARTEKTIVLANRSDE